MITDDYIAKCKKLEEVEKLVAHCEEPERLKQILHVVLELLDDCLTAIDQLNFPEGH